MTRFYGRLWEVLLDGETYIAPTSGRQFRVVFNILVDLGGSITYADIAIYNLNQSTALKVLRRGVEIGFRGGYDGLIDYLFSGRITNVLRERNGSDTIVRILAKGGSQPKQQIVNVALGKNARVTDIIKSCATATGYSLVLNENDFAQVDPYPRGYTCTGDPFVQLDSLGKRHNFQYTIENDRLIVVGDGSFREGDPIVVNELNGMEGIPEITENGVDVSLRLMPKLKIGGRVDIRSELATFNFGNMYFQDVPENAGSGIYNIYRLVHAGDSYGESWTTRVTGYR
ncbi:MAG: hypothetical protein KAR42_11085 [candidate division Zixibacteria bacterium]|nr:hypothetical protein [candidate division Zixibacteria bacterium]